MNVPSIFSRVSAASLGNVIMDAAPLVGGVPRQLPTSHYCLRRTRQHNPSWADRPNPGREIRELSCFLCPATSRLRARCDTLGPTSAGPRRKMEIKFALSDADDRPAQSTAAWRMHLHCPARHPDGRDRGHSTSSTSTATPSFCFGEPT